MEVRANYGSENGEINMNKIKENIFPIIVGALLGAFLLIRLSLPESVHVSHVIDGDTIVILRDNRQEIVRLFGIDAPESNQPYGKKAMLFANLSLTGEQVILKEQKKKGVYGRTIAVVELNGKDFNRKMVENGLAWAYRKYSTNYVESEEVARAKRAGLWKRDNPKAPSVWRTERKKGKPEVFTTPEEL